MDELSKYSDFEEAQEKAKKYLDDDVILFSSPRKDKKYRIYNPIKDKWVDFGAMFYEDFTKHKDENRRNKYLARATKIKGNWRGDKYSPNNLSLFVLWDYGR